MRRYRVVRQYWEPKDKFVYAVQRERVIKHKWFPFLNKTDWVNMDENERAYETFIGGWDDIVEAQQFIERQREKDIKHSLSGTVVYEE